MTKHIPQRLKVSVRGPVTVQGTAEPVWAVTVAFIYTDQIIIALYYDVEAVANQVAQSIADSIRKSLLLEIP